MRMTSGDWGLLILLSLLWGGSFFFSAVAVQDIPPLTLVVLRTGIAALALAPIALWRGPGALSRRAVLTAVAIMGFLNNFLPFSLIFWAQTQIPSGLASILNATTPIFSIIIAHFALADERMAPGKAIGILFGFLGVVVLFARPRSGAVWALRGSGCSPVLARRFPTGLPVPMGGDFARWDCARRKWLSGSLRQPR